MVHVVKQTIKGGACCDWQGVSTSLHISNLVTSLHRLEKWEPRDQRTNTRRRRNTLNYLEPLRYLYDNTSALINDLMNILNRDIRAFRGPQQSTLKAVERFIAVSSDMNKSEMTAACGRSRRLQWFYIFTPVRRLCSSTSITSSVSVWNQLAHSQSPKVPWSPPGPLPASCHVTRHSGLHKSLTWTNPWSNEARSTKTTESCRESLHVNNTSCR